MRLVFLCPAAVMVFASAMAYTGRIPAGWFDSPWDKVVHLLLYGWLAAATALVLPERLRPLGLWAPLALGLADELLQKLSTKRSPDVMDFAADAAGVILGYVVVRSTSR